MFSALAISAHSKAFRVCIQASKSCQEMQKHKEVPGGAIAQYFGLFVCICSIYIYNNSPTVTLLLLVLKESRAAVRFFEVLEKWRAPWFSEIALSLVIAKDLMNLPCHWPKLGATWTVVAMAGTSVPVNWSCVFTGAAKLCFWQLDVHTSLVGFWDRASLLLSHFPHVCQSYLTESGFCWCWPYSWTSW